VRSGQWKFIAAPTSELYDIASDAAERNNLARTQASIVESFDKRIARYSTVAMPSLADGLSRESAERLRALGYTSGGASTINPQSSILNPQSKMRPDPKDRRELAARLAQVMSGELTGNELIAALETIVREDPHNGQAHLRLGYARVQSGDCARAEPEFRAAIATGLPSGDADLGLATCLGRRGDLAGAEKALADAQRIEPDNPVIMANVGILQASKGNLTAAIDVLTRALTKDPDLHEARFNLAVAYAKAGRRAEAAAAARELLRRLPPSAPQRPEVERLLRAVQ
jgi:cytochrome c-type biogenesis protein CcmH/NrfG